MLHKDQKTKLKFQKTNVLNESSSSTSSSSSSEDKSINKNEKNKIVHQSESLRQTLD